MILGIVGKKGSGKSTLALYLQGVLYPNKVEIVSLGDLIIKDLSDVVGVDCAELEQRKRTSIDARALLQCWGEYRKIINTPQYWLNKVEFKDDTIIIIPSIRFIHEAYFVTERKGFLIKIEGRQELTGNERIDNHISELELDDINNINYTILNDKRKEWLKFEAKNIKELLQL
jgi:energy-coupling factor transporter ATP-binding protein EcfA2